MILNPTAMTYFKCGLSEIRVAYFVPGRTGLDMKVVTNQPRRAESTVIRKRAERAARNTVSFKTVLSPISDTRMDSPERRLFNICHSDYSDKVLKTTQRLQN